MANWIFKTAVIDGHLCEIDGLNIWDYDWFNTREYIGVKDPIYEEVHTINIYQIITANKTISFAAGEFSNMVWGIYVRSES